MRFGCIVLYIFGSGSEDAYEQFRKDLIENDEHLLEPDSVSAMGIVRYRQNDFSSEVVNALNRICATAAAQAGVFQSNKVHCVFMMNHTMHSESWAKCVADTRGVMAKNGLASSYTAIVHKDDMDLEPLIPCLSASDMTTLLFTQKTSAGPLFASKHDEQMLMMYYALLAGCDLLPKDNRIYTGSFDQLNLKDRDFERIRLHYAARALTHSDRMPSRDEMFCVFFGDVIGINSANVSDADLERQLAEKLRVLFPKRERLVLLANRNQATAMDNIARFIELNYNLDEDGYFRRFLKRFESPISGKKHPGTPERLMQEWSDKVDDAFRKNMKYCCTEVCDYIDELAKWLRAEALSLEKTAEDTIRRNGVVGSIDERTFLQSTIDVIEENLKPYQTLTGVHMMRAMADRLIEKADAWRNRIGLRDHYVRKWRISDAELQDAKRYAKDIIDSIEKHCNTNGKPDLLIKDTRSFFDENTLGEAWTTQVEELVKTLQNQNIIDKLNSLNTAVFQDAISKLFQGGTDTLYRLNLANAQTVTMDSVGIVYIYCDTLQIDETQKRVFPGWDRTRDRAESVRDLKNILRFSLARLGLIGESEQTITSPEELEARKAKILKELPKTYRIADTAQDGKDYVPVLPNASVNPTLPTGETQTLQVQTNGGSVTLTLPMDVDFGKDVKYTINGYTIDGGRVVQPTKWVHPTALALQIPIQGLYGHCSMDVAYYHKAGKEPIEEVCAFEGRKAEPEQYKCSKPLASVFASRIHDAEGNEIRLTQKQFKLTDASSMAMKVCVIVDDNADELRYPIGEGTKWNVFAAKEDEDSLRLIADDEAGVRTLDERR